jgi:signal peptidase I
MEPTFHTGDLVVTRNAGDYKVGDVIVYTVSEGQREGLRVIHRVTDVAPDGTMTTLGDNNATVDSWKVRPGDVSGRQWLFVPGGQRFLTLMRPMGALIAALGLVSFLRKRPAQRTAAQPEMAPLTP